MKKLPYISMPSESLGYAHFIFKKNGHQVVQFMFYKYGNEIKIYNRTIEDWQKNFRFGNRADGKEFLKFIFSKNWMLKNAN